MNANLHPSWKTILQSEMDKQYFTDLTSFVENAYNNTTCYPPKELIFAAFNYCPFQDIKVVIIGQDPYHGPDQANGLCFSVEGDSKHPPSLKNIFKELETDIDLKYPESGDLSKWAHQGVLLLNATLTVQAHNAASHQKQGWETFTDAIIKKISDEKEGVIFLLWGGYAKKKQKLISQEKHSILTAGHPSPLSANRGFWFNNKHFSKTNSILKERGSIPINWSV